MDQLANAIQDIKDIHGEQPETFEVISYIKDNWVELTGTSEDEIDAEQEFDDMTLEITDAFGICYDDLCEEW